LANQPYSRRLLCSSGLGFRIIAAPRGLSPQCAYRVGRTKNRTRLFSDSLSGIKWSIFQPNGDFLRESPLSYFRLPRRFKRAIRAIDSTTIELIAKCMDWAKHRKHKAAAKVHVALDLISFIPIRVVTD